MKRYFLAAAFAAAATLAGPASAATIDFTDRSVWNGALDTDSAGGAIVSLTSTGGVISFAENFDRTRAPACAGFGGQLACDSDGLGVVDDEISASGRGAETVTLLFSTPVTIVAFSVLDLYIAANGDDLERAELFFNGDESTLLSFNAVELFDGDAAGFASFALAPTLASSVTFRAARTNDNLGVADFALASVRLSPIPLPATAWMLIAGVGLLAAGKRARRA